MKNCILTFFLLGENDATAGRNRHLRRSRNHLRALRKDEKRISNLDPRITSGCTLTRSDDVELLEAFQFVEPESGKKIFFGTNIDVERGNPQAAKNTVPGTFPDDVIWTRSNGYCDKGVYKSWNKCNINGECFVECTNGLCHEQHKNDGERINVPGQCDDWYRRCATECKNDPNCKAFTFLDTNVLGHPEYTCHFMSELLCKHSEMSLSDPRSSFQVKGAHMAELYAKYGSGSFTELDNALANDPQFKFGHWSSWGYHECRNTPAPACGEGVQRRTRILEDSGSEVESRPCSFSDDDGNLIPCETISGPEEGEPGHGWTSWGLWSACSKTCGNSGTRTRFRGCAECPNPDSDGLCSAESLDNYRTRAIAFKTSEYEFCPNGGEKESESCQLGRCLPWTHGRNGWKQNGVPEFKIKHLWNIGKTSNFSGDETDWEGGCRNYNDAYKILNLDSGSQSPPFHNQKYTFAECIRICQLEEKANCLSVMFFPSSSRWGQPDITRFYGNDGDGNALAGNCYLFNKRCHEDGAPRDAAFLDDLRAQKEAAGEEFTGKEAAKSWYAYKDLCSAPKSFLLSPCNWLSNYYAAECDSSGDRGFPNTDVCRCPMSGDRWSSVRAWGNPYAPRWQYDPSIGAIQRRDRNPDLGNGPVFYSVQKYNNRIFNGKSIEFYEEHMREGTMACHNPCDHNRCQSGSQCQLNPEAEFGYDCLCEWPYAPDPERFGEDKLPLGLAGYGDNNGCVSVDHRNTAPDYKDNLILFGGGWNPQTVSGEALPKPHYQYYGLKSESPHKFKVSFAPQRIPATDPDAHKAKFYNCMMNIDDNKVMVVGGRPGQFFDTFDDKTYVYQWDEEAEGIEEGGKWIDVDGNRMDDSKEACEGLAGCIRPNEWPDLPSVSVLNCQGQCRNGDAGRGPTDPRWLHSYCTVSADFWNGNDWEARTFELCQNRLLETSSEDGIAVRGLEGFWTSEENPNYHSNWAEYRRLILLTKPFYHQSNLHTPDIETAQMLSTMTYQGEEITVTRELRWKYPMNSTLYNPILGPVTFRDIMAINGLPDTRRPNFRESFKDYLGPGQPACGVMGDKAYVGSGKFARLISLKYNNAKSEIWRVEEGSEFPFPFKKSDGSQCLMNNLWGTDPAFWRKDQLPNFRQNYGTVVTNQGLWIIGGLMAASSDLPNRDLNKRYNIEGCTKHGHLRDVWVFNPNGWSRSEILGEAGEKYSGLEASEILPQKIGYPFGQDMKSRISTTLDQDFEEFHLSDTAGGNFSLTTDLAIEEGWQCTGVQGKWCRKPYLPRETKGAEAFVMCFEPGTGSEKLSNTRRYATKTIPRRPRVCSVEETKHSDNRCICYIMNVSGQSGPKQTEGGAGFRPEVDYVEIPRADGTYGSDHESYAEELKEYCPNAEASFPEVDEPIVHGNESPVADYTECTNICDVEGAPDCNRIWKKKNLRRAWHEAGRIKHARMGFLAGQIKGEIVIWGGECYGPTTQRQWNLDGSPRATRVNFQPRACKANIQNGKVLNDDYMEVFSFLRMNAAGFIFGERRYVELEGYVNGRVNHDESAVAQSFNAFNKAF